MLQKAVSKAAASEEARRTLRYVEPLSDARTPLADFFSILLGIRTWRKAGICVTYMWYNVAAASLTREVKKAVAVENRDEIAGRMTPAQIAKA